MADSAELKIVVTEEQAAQGQAGPTGGQPLAGQGLAGGDAILQAKFRQEAVQQERRLAMMAKEVADREAAEVQRRRQWWADDARLKAERLAAQQEALAAEQLIAQQAREAAAMAKLEPELSILPNRELNVLPASWGPLPPEHPFAPLPRTPGVFDESEPGLLPVGMTHRAPGGPVAGELPDDLRLLPPGESQQMPHGRGWEGRQRAGDIPEVLPVHPEVSPLGANAHLAEVLTAGEAMAADWREAAEEAKEIKALREAAFKAFREMFGERSKQEIDDLKTAQQKVTNERLRNAGEWGAVGFGLQAAGVPGGRMITGAASAYGAGVKAADAATSLGLIGPSSALAVAAPLALAGAAIVHQIGETINKGLQDTFKSVASIARFDAPGFERGVASLAGNIPIIGGLTGTLAHGFLDLSDAVDQTGRRLAQYNGALASTVAMIDMNRILRDMDRAQRHGPEIADAMMARENFNIRIEEMMDRWLPTILRVLTALLDMVEAGIDAGSRQWNTFIELQATIVELLPLVGEDAARDIRRLLIDIRDNTDRGLSGDLIAQNIQELMTTVGPDSTGFSDAQRQLQRDRAREAAAAPALGI